MKDFKFILLTFVATFLTNSGAQASSYWTEAHNGLMRFSERYIEFLCQGQSACLEVAGKSIANSLERIDTARPIGVIRNQALAFMKESLIKEFIQEHYLQDDPGLWRQRIWNEFDVLVLPGGYDTPSARTIPWKEEDLKILYQGYIKLREAISRAVGADRVDEFSHVWGAGGLVARTLPRPLLPGQKPVSGQVGDVFNLFSIQINIVNSPTQFGYTSLTLAQRIAHENAHSQDYLYGALRNVIGSNWTETSAAQIFKHCQLPARYETPLLSCIDKNPEWFNFHPTKYGATNSAEFYTKMLDEWVRENLGLVKKKVLYRCQSPETLGFWREMEKQFLGEILSKDCNF